MATRTCVTCGLTETADHFSRRQWRKGVGRSRCYTCVTQTDTIQHDESAIHDNTLNAYFSNTALESPFEAGGFRWVALGHYTDGDRQGEPCVAKWLIEEDAYSTADYRQDLRCVYRTLDFVRAFNALNIIDIPIRVHIPSTHRFGSDTSLPHVVYLREPFIEGYDKWNSNSGWVNEETEFADAMQALSHFSYHSSGGQHLLCDLQGGLYETEAVLSDPAILSVHMDYGSTDMGVHGILSFFHQHTCNQFCDPNWMSPVETGQYIESEINTVVVWDRERHDNDDTDEHEEENELEQVVSEDEAESEISQDYDLHDDEYYDSDDGVSDSDTTSSQISVDSNSTAKYASDGGESESQVSFRSYRYDQSDSDSSVSQGSEVSA